MNDCRDAVQTGELQNCAIESHSARREPVEVRRLSPAIAVGSHHVGGVIVGADPEDVETRGRLGRANRAAAVTKVAANSTRIRAPAGLQLSITVGDRSRR